MQQTRLSEILLLFPSSFLNCVWQWIVSDSIVLCVTNICSNHAYYACYYTSGDSYHKLRSSPRFSPFRICTRDAFNIYATHVQYPSERRYRLKYNPTPDVSDFAEKEDAGVAAVSWGEGRSRGRSLMPDL